MTLSDYDRATLRRMVDDEAKHVAGLRLYGIRCTDLSRELEAARAVVEAAREIARAEFTGGYRRSLLVSLELAIGTYDATAQPEATG